VRFASGKDIVDDARRVILPPPTPIPHAEFCRTVFLPDGPLRGTRYNPAADPAHAVMAQQFADGRWQRIIAVGAVQTGKSLSTILVPILRNLTVLRHPVVYSLPTADKLYEGWGGKLQPSIIDSGYSDWLPDKGQGARGSQTPKFVVFRDPRTRSRAGTMYLIPGGGAKEGGKAAVTARLVCIDEVDSFKDRHSIELVCKRADSYGNRACRVLTSTVKADGEVGTEDGSMILALYEESTKSRLWFACPHCGHWQVLQWDMVTYDASDEPAAIATARYTCPHCAATWTEDDRQEALRSWRLVHDGQSIDQDTGTVIGTPKPTVAFGLLWTSLDSSLRSLGQLASEHWRASRAVKQGEHGSMRSFYRDQLCQPYRGDLGDEVPRTDQMALVARSHRGLPLGDRPEDAEVVTVGADVQKREAWWVTLGMASDLRWWIMDYGYRSTGREHSEPTPEEQVAFLDAMDRRVRKAAGIIDELGVDVGYNTDLVVQWAARKGWIPVRGDTRPSGGHRENNAGLSFLEIRRQQDRSMWHFIAGDTVKTEIMRGLVREVDEPGAGHLPKMPDAKDYLPRHLTSEVWSEKDRKWLKRTSIPNHLLDALVYAYALARLRIARPKMTAKLDLPIGSDGVFAGLMG
jgi:phage terminase large subunit GpA-like protein